MSKLNNLFYLRIKIMISDFIPRVDFKSNNQFDSAKKSTKSKSSPNSSILETSYDNISNINFDLESLLSSFRNFFV